MEGTHEHRLQIIKHYLFCNWHIPFDLCCGLFWLYPSILISSNKFINLHHPRRSFVFCGCNVFAFITIYRRVAN